MRINRGIWVVLLAGVFACGGDDDDGVGNSGVDSNAALSELSESDAEAICEEIAGALEAGLSDLQTVVCYFIGISSGDKCEAVVEDCLAEPLGDSSEEFPLTCELTTTELPDCAADVTVGDFEACFNAAFDLLANLADDITCESSLEDLNAAMTLPDACADLVALCPELPGFET